MSIVISLEERRRLASKLTPGRRFRVIDCQAERLPALPTAYASWGRSMLRNAFRSIEDNEGVSAALAAVEQLINEYRQ